MGDAIFIRPFKVEDANAHLLGEDDEQVKWLSGGKSNIEVVRNWIRKNEEYWKNNGPIFCFAIVEKETDQLVGMVEANSDYKDLDGLKEGDVNISYGIYPKFRGNEYASQAVVLVCEFLKERGFSSAVIRVNPENINSLKIPLKCGFEKQSIITTRDGETLQIFVKELS